MNHQEDDYYVGKIAYNLCIRLYNAESAAGWGACLGMITGLALVAVYIWLDGGFTALL